MDERMEYFLEKSIDRQTLKRMPKATTQLQGK